MSYCLCVKSGAFIGRGAASNPPNRFEEIAVQPAPDDIAQYFEDSESDRKILTKFYFDHTRSILARNESPDLGFTYSVNPYRGCEHGCIYCYARPSHEYLGFSSGVDFESKILVKLHAASLLKESFLSKSWVPQTILLSGDTDCYQPVERKLRLTRECLKVFLTFMNPVSIITKNALIQRDVDILKDLAASSLVSVTLSITTLDEALARRMEPRTSSPANRLETVKTLAGHGIPVNVNIAPVIPGLNDVEIPSIVKQAAAYGALGVNYSMLRLPYAVKDLFMEWLKRELPEKAQKIENRMRGIRNGELNDSKFGLRMSGEGKIAESIDQLFTSAVGRSGLNKSKPELATHLFARERDQLKLF
jgi:DNA repair photolyase